MKIRLPHCARAVPRDNELSSRLFALVGSFGSIVALVVIFFPESGDPEWWVIALLIVSGILFVWLLVQECRAARRRTIFSIDDAEGIRTYMHDWILPGGRVAVWTRDMSWADNAETRELLRTKAERGELIICVPKPRPFTDELAESGAEIYAYEGLSGAPQSRFTIVQYGQGGSRVAVGRRAGGNHVIEEFSLGEHPAFHLAEDLVQLAMQRTEERLSDA